MNPDERQDLVDTARALIAGLTEVASLGRGLQLNHVLFSGSVILQGTGVGVSQQDWSVPFAMVAVQCASTSGGVTVAADTQANQAPTDGVGVFHVGPDAMMCWPITGRVLTIYGTPGDIVDVAVFSKPMPPSAA
jgi:hypothetical protein